MPIFSNDGIQHFIQGGTTTSETLKQGVYYLRLDDRKGFYFEKTNEFVLPKKLYGDFSVCERYLSAFKHTSKNLGILLSGIKGSGKTLLMKKLAIESGLPVIIIDKNWDTSLPVEILTSPEVGEAIVMFDEFEKTFSHSDDNYATLLSFLDGTSVSKLLFLFTVNETKVSELLINRPSRIRYRKHFDTLPDSVVDEVLDDLLINQAHRNSVYAFFQTLGIVTYDLLITLIQEMNLFGESALESGTFLNVVPELIYYKITEVFRGQSSEAYSHAYPSRISTSDGIELSDLYFQKDRPLENEFDIMYKSMYSNKMVESGQRDGFGQNAVHDFEEVTNLDKSDERDYSDSTQIILSKMGLNISAEVFNRSNAFQYYYEDGFDIKVDSKSHGKFVITHPDIPEWSIIIAPKNPYSHLF